MAKTNHANGTATRKANGTTTFSVGESKAILELSLRENIPADELAEVLSTLAWLHQTLSGSPASVESIAIN